MNEVILLGEQSSRYGGCWCLYYLCTLLHLVRNVSVSLLSNNYQINHERINQVIAFVS